MKKILSIILVLVMATVPAVAAFAAGSGSSSINGENDSSINVSGTYTSSTTPDTLISVDIAWDEMKFTYSQGSLGTWDPGSHDYINPGQGSWTSDTATITITNHSNTDIRADFTFEMDDALLTEEGLSINGTFSKTTLVIDSADNDKYRAQAGSTTVSAPSDSTEFGIRSDSDAISGEKKLGTVSVAISKMTWQTVGTPAELEAAIAAADEADTPCYIKLTNDIAIVNDDNRLRIPMEAGILLDLGGHTLMAAVIVGNARWAVIQNGTLKASESGFSCALVSECNDFVVKNCVIESTGEYSAELYYGEATLIDCTVKDGSIQCGTDSNVVLVGTTLVPGVHEGGETKTIYISEGASLTTPFDPTSMIDDRLLLTDYLNISDNGDGTWTASRP